MRQNPHVRICGGPGSATTLVYPTGFGQCDVLHSAYVKRAVQLSYGCWGRFIRPRRSWKRGSWAVTCSELSLSFAENVLVQRVK